MLVDQLLKINALKKSERKQLAIMTVKNNSTFARYMKLCYGDEYKPRENFKKINLKFRPSESPLGMDFGSLESVYSKFASTVFDINNVDMSPEISNTRLIQIFEVISEHEVEFLKQVIKCKFSGLTKIEYDKIIF